MENSPRLTVAPPLTASALGPVAAIVLAAGASTRLGAGPVEAAAPVAVKGRTLLRHSVEQALASSCRARHRRPRAPRSNAASASSRASTFMSHDQSSVGRRHGLVDPRRHDRSDNYAAPGARAVVITLCDQPLVGAAFIDRLVQRYQAEAAGREPAKRRARGGRVRLRAGAPAGVVRLRSVVRLGERCAWMGRAYRGRRSMGVPASGIVSTIAVRGVVASRRRGRRAASAACGLAQRAAQGAASVTTLTLVPRPTMRRHAAVSRSGGRRRYDYRLRGVAQ